MQAKCDNCFEPAAYAGRGETLCDMCARDRSAREHGEVHALLRMLDATAAHLSLFLSEEEIVTAAREAAAGQAIDPFVPSAPAWSFDFENDTRFMPIAEGAIR